MTTRSVDLENAPDFLAIAGAYAGGVALALIRPIEDA